MKDKPKDISYYLTLFQIEGHQTWRTHLDKRPDSFDKHLVPVTKITKTQRFKIDRITGVISPIK